MNMTDEMAVSLHSDTVTQQVMSNETPMGPARTTRPQKPKKYVSHLKVASVQRFRRKHDIVNLLVAVPRPFRVMVQTEARRRGLSMAIFVKQAISAAMQAPCATPEQARSVEDLLPKEHTCANRSEPRLRARL